MANVQKKEPRLSSEGTQRQSARYQATDLGATGYFLGALFTWRHFAILAVTLAALANFGAFSARLWFVVRSGPFAATTGFEEFCLYDIWKVTHQFPVYEWPQRDHFLLSFYNAGFYHTYGSWAKLWGADSAEIVRTVRLLTPLFGLMGAIMQMRVVHQLIGIKRRLQWLWVIVLSLLTWFGTSFAGWFVVSVRPDVPAVAFAVAGLSVVLSALNCRRLWLWLLASLLFWIAWSFKQSVVWSFAGIVGCAAVFRVGWVRVATFVIPWAFGVGAMIVGGGAAYRYNIFVVPHLFAWFPRQSVYLVAEAAVLNLFVVVFGGVWIWNVVSRWSAARRSEAIVAVCCGVALVAGAGQLALRGSNINNVMEGFVLLSVASIAGWLSVWETEHRHAMSAAGMVALLGLTPLPIIQLWLGNRGTTYETVHGTSIGNVIKLNSRQLEQRKRFAAWMRTLPQPLWIRDAMLQMPWFATNNTYPAFVLNEEFATDAKAHHVIVGAGFSDWIARRYFAALLLRSDDPLYETALQAGYTVSTVPTRFASVPSEFGLDGPGPQLLIRDTQARSRSSGP